MTALKQSQSSKNGNCHQDFDSCFWVKISLVKFWETNFNLKYVFYQ